MADRLGAFAINLVNLLFPYGKKIARKGGKNGFKPNFIEQSS
jgi:hypothetical protein